MLDSVDVAAHLIATFIANLSKSMDSPIVQCHTTRSSAMAVRPARTVWHERLYLRLTSSIWFLLQRHVNGTTFMGVLVLRRCLVKRNFRRLVLMVPLQFLLGRGIWMVIVHQGNNCLLLKTVLIDTYLKVYGKYNFKKNLLLYTGLFRKNVRPRAKLKIKLCPKKWCHWHLIFFEWLYLIILWKFSL